MGERRLRVRTHPPHRPAEGTVRFISLALGERAIARVLLDGTLESALAQDLMPGTRSPTRPSSSELAGRTCADEARSVARRLEEPGEFFHALDLVG